MAKGQQHIFLEDSDTDSINTTTTAESDQDVEKQYDVEKILAEERAVDGEMQYLLKWERYPMYRCTWEKKDSIESELLFAEWEKWKSRVKHGKESPFDVDKYNQAVEEWEEEKEEKKRRRKVKRRKRGERVPSTGDNTSYEDEPEPEPQPLKRTRITKVRTKRKGIAQPTTKQRRSTIPNVDDDEAAEEADSSDVDSLFGERRRTAPPLIPPKRKSNVRNTMNTAPQMAAASSTTTAPIAAAPKRKSTVEATGARASGTASRPQAILSTKRAQPSSGAAKKSAPSAAAKPSNVFSGDWTEEKKKRQRVRVNGETPKDSTDLKFTHLAVQNRYQKYSKNEPAPDLNALGKIDPKTGKIETPKTANVRLGPVGIRSAFGRRTSPPALKPILPRSPSPEPFRVPQVQPQGPPIRPDSKNDIACKHWLNGGCSYTADTCWYAHRHIDETSTTRPAKKHTTCYYWHNGGNCMKSERECDFAHWDTGVYAGPPGSFRRRSTFVNTPGVKESDLRLMNSENGQNQVSDEVAPAIPGAMLHNAMAENRAGSKPVTAFVHEAPALDRANAASGKSPTVGDIPCEKAPEAPSKEIPKTAIAMPNDNDRTIVPSALMDIDEDGYTAAHASDDRDSGDPGDEEAIDSTVGPAIDEFYTENDIPTELEMAKDGIQNLDSNRLLAEKTGNVIGYVYLHFPPERGACLLLLKCYFEGLNCKVLTSQNPGSWALFRKNFGKSCLLVLHPSEMFNGTIPGLHSFLTANGLGVRVFTIGVQDRICRLEGRNIVFEAQRIFPHGGITYLTDDVLMYYPEKATEIIKQFIEGNRFKPPGAELSKVGARPGVKQWMLEMAMKQLDAQGGEAGGKHEKLMHCWLALDELSPMEDEDPYYYPRSVPLQTSNLWSDDPDCLPSIKGRWEKGDEEGLTDYMANFFAGVACDWLTEYRKFFFVYQRPGVDEVDPKGWGEKYCHVGVIRPEHVLKMMGKK